MKPMLDNAIDNLFKSSLEDYEIKPSAGSWKKINAQRQRKQGKNNQSYWFAAASVLLILGLGLWFSVSNQEVIKLSGNRKIASVNEDVMPVESKVIAKQPVFEVVSLDEVKRANEKRFLSLMAKTNAPIIKKTIKPKEDVLSNKNAMSSAFHINIDENRKEDATTTPTDARLVTNTTKATEEPVLAVSQQTENAPALNKAASSFGEKNIIRSVGDLVNFVIAKVDGREQKLLHVSRTEESDMEITQINLGLIKYKKN